MKVERGRPIITSEDYPKIVYDALLESIPYHNANSPRERALAWCKTAQDSYETVHDAFGVGYGDPIEDWPSRGDAMLYMTLDQLELALVNYGCEKIEEKVDDEVTKVNYLLCAIDGLQQRVRRLWLT